MLATMTGENRVHWEDYAKFWDRVGPPLRPCAEDVAYFERRVGKRFSDRHVDCERALILGVTPEFASMKWPVGCSVIGIDVNFGMVQGVWPAHDIQNPHVVCGNWQHLPLATDSVEV